MTSSPAAGTPAAGTPAASSPTAGRFSGDILVVGAGYVGLTVAACFAHLQRSVVCADNDSEKIQRLNAGNVGIAEPGLAELVEDGLRSDRLRFVDDVAAAAQACEFVFLCVQTPLGEDGSTDTTYLMAASATVGAALQAEAVVVSKSTMPVGGHKLVSAAIGRDDVAVVSNPEFLSQGNAVRDFLQPDRVVIGADSQSAAERVAALYDWIKSPVIITDPTSAEVAKFAANAFLATKVSFVNELTAVCEAVGANIDDVLAGVRQDHRIGGMYLQPGPGWGGSCLPKDTRALVYATREAGYVFDLLEGAIQANEQQLDRIVAKVVSAVAAGTAAASTVAAGTGLQGITVGVLGLTFKAGTDDLRGSPAIDIAHRLAKLGARLQAFDPAISPADSSAVGPAGSPAGGPSRSDRTGDSADSAPAPATPSEALTEALLAALSLKNSVADAARGADVLVVLTEWPEFADCDWSAIAEQMKVPRMVDARNLLDPDKLKESGFAYQGLGRSEDIACS